MLFVSGKLDAIDVLVQNGANINGIQLDKGGVTPLSYVIAHSSRYGNWNLQEKKTLQENKRESFRRYT